MLLVLTLALTTSVSEYKHTSCQEFGWWEDARTRSVSESAAPVNAM
jgi:hypothetical protein